MNFPSTIWTLKDLYNTWEERSKNWDVYLSDGDLVWEYFSGTFHEWESDFLSRNWKLWIDFMGSWFCNSDNVDRLLWVRLLDWWTRALMENVRLRMEDWFQFDGSNLRPKDMVTGNVYSGRLWRDLDTKIHESWTNPDLIVVRPQWWWNFIDRGYTWDKSSLDAIFSSIGARFILIEKLYERLAVDGVMFVEIPIPMFESWDFNGWNYHTEKYFLDQIIQCAYREWIKSVRTGHSIRAIRIEKKNHHDMNPCHYLKEQASKIYSSRLEMLTL